jgi:hypothetical protein
VKATSSIPGHVTSGKQLAHSAADLLDSEVKQVLEVVVNVQERYQYRSNTATNLEALRDELLTRLMDIGIIATVDPSPCLYGEPPDLEIIGSTRLDAHDGFDHERKRAEVVTANVRKEDYLGQKGKSA